MLIHIQTVLIVKFSSLHEGNVCVLNGAKNVELTTEKKTGLRIAKKKENNSITINNRYEIQETETQFLNNY